MNKLKLVDIDHMESVKDFPGYAGRDGDSDVEFIIMYNVIEMSGLKFEDSETIYDDGVIEYFVNDPKFDKWVKKYRKTMKKYGYCLEHMTNSRSLVGRFYLDCDIAGICVESFYRNYDIVIDGADKYMSDELNDEIYGY